MINSDKKEQALQFTSFAAALLDQSRDVTVTSVSEYEDASAVLVELKKQQKEVKQLKDSVLAPLKQATDAFRSLIRPAEKALAEIESRLKGAVAGYLSDIEERNRAVLEAAAKETDTRAMVETLQAVEAAPKAQGVSTSTSWQAEIVDASLVPYDWCAPDLALIEREVRRTRGTCRIPGVKAVEKKTVRVRT